MKEERETGFIDEDMNYVFKKEKGEVDAWVADLDEAAMEKAIGEAALAEKKRLARQAQRESQRNDLDSKTPLDLKLELLTYLSPGENIKSALRRLSGKDGIEVFLPFFYNHKFLPMMLHFLDEESKFGGGMRRRRAPGSDVVSFADQKAKKKLSAAEQNRLARENRGRIERITELANSLITHGLTGVYNMSYEALQASTVLWEYRGADGNIYGPFDSSQISGWKKQGFLTGPTAVMMRRVVVKNSAVLGRKRARFEDNANDSESIYDDIDSTKRARLDGDTSVAVAAAPAPISGTSAAASVDDEPWVHSDSIDFGEFVDLSSGHGDSLTGLKSNGNSFGRKGKNLDKDSDDDSADEGNGQDLDDDDD